MEDPDHLLSFVADDDGSMVSVHLDLAGVNKLIEELGHIRDQLVAGDCPHTHLFGPESYGELTLTMLSDQPAEKNSVEHVKIYGWTEEWAVRHGLKPSPD